MRVRRQQALEDFDEVGHPLVRSYSPGEEKDILFVAYAQCAPGHISRNVVGVGSQIVAVTRNAQFVTRYRKMRFDFSQRSDRVKVNAVGKLNDRLGEFERLRVGLAFHDGQRTPLPEQFPLRFVLGHDALISWPRLRQVYWKTLNAEARRPHSRIEPPRPLTYTSTRHERRHC